MAKKTKNVKSQQKCQKLKKKKNMLKITENAKYHQESQISPNITKIAQNAKTENTKNAKYHQKCQISPKMQKLPKMPKPKKLNITKIAINNQK